MQFESIDLHTHTHTHSHTHTHTHTHQINNEIGLDRQHRNIRKRRHRPFQNTHTRTNTHTHTLTHTLTHTHTKVSRFGASEFISSRFGRSHVPVFAIKMRPGFNRVFGLFVCLFVCLLHNEHTTRTSRRSIKDNAGRH